MNVAVLKTKGEQALTETFAAIADKLPGGAATLKHREEAIGRFSALGLPHRRIEAWKYTDLRNLMKEALPPSVVVSVPVSAKQLDEVLGPLAKLEATRVVFVDGFYAEALSDTRSVPGLAVMALRHALQSEDDRRYRSPTPSTRPAMTSLPAWRLTHFGESRSHPFPMKLS